MAEFLNDDFESGSLALWDSVASVLVDTSSLMTGANCADFTSTASHLAKNVSMLDIWGQLNVLPKNQASNFDGSILEILDYPTCFGSIRFVNVSESPITYNIAVYRGFSTQLALGSTVINAGDIHTIKFHYKSHLTDGIFRVWIDDVLEIDFAGQTAPNSNAVDRIFLGSIGCYDGLVAFQDNVILYDADPGWEAEEVEPYVQTVTGGAEVGGETSPTYEGRSLYSPADDPEAVLSAVGGVEVGGTVVPVFVVPDVYAVVLPSGLTPDGVTVGGSPVPVFVIPATYLAVIEGGIRVGGRTSPVFVSPAASLSESWLYVQTVTGGAEVGGTPTPVFIIPETYLVTVAGGVKVGGPAVSGVQFVAPAGAAGISISASGGIVVGGETFPVFVVPPVYRVPVDPRIIANILIGGGGGVAFITPQVFVAEVEGDVIVGMGTELDTDEVYETWALGGKNNEPSIISGYRFNSYALINGKAYAAADDGLYVIGGENDNGEVIHPGVRIGPMNFGLDCKKRLRAINVGRAGPDTKVRVEVVDGAEGTFTYRSDPRRITIDRNLEGEEFYIDIIDFVELSHLEIIPLVLFKK